MVVTGDTFLVGVADGGVAAGGVALAAVTVEAGIAVLVSSAFFAGRGLLNDWTCAEWVQLALNLRFTDETFRAFTSRSMEDNSANGIFTASGTK